MFPIRTRPESSPCKCCDYPAALFDLCDFNKSCEEKHGKHLPLSGIAVYYYKCSHCGFIFTRDLDQGTDAEFKEHIYNDDYIKVDPDYDIVRPQINAKMIIDAFGLHCSRLNILDYGGGNGKLAGLLSQGGAKQAVSYDPFYNPRSARPKQKYEMVTAFEVIEHVPDPIATFKEMASFLNTDNGIMIFSTVLQPEDIDAVRARWWYIAPRNGHISIHTFKSLSISLAKVGLTLASSNQSMHLAFKRIPDFAQHLFGKAKRVEKPATKREEKEPI